MRRYQNAFYTNVNLILRENTVIIFTGIRPEEVKTKKESQRDAAYSMSKVCYVPYTI